MSMSMPAAAHAAILSGEELGEFERNFLRLVAAECTEPKIRAVMGGEPGHDPHLWRMLADEFALQSLAIPAGLGGAGLGWAPLTIAMSALGGRLSCEPVLSTCALATPILLSLADSEAARDLLSRIAAGQARVAVALQGADDVFARSNDGPDAAGADGWQVDGVLDPVIEGTMADVVLTRATLAGRAAWFAIEAGARGVGRERIESFDATRPLARFVLQGASATLLHSAADADEAGRRGVTTGRIMLAAEQLGGAQAMFERTLDHVKTRSQFGRPLGSFQAIKHICADMFVELESARTVVGHLTDLLAAGQEVPEADAGVAALQCARAFLMVAERSIDLHGAIAYTWEHPAHLYLRRAKSGESLFGSPRDQRRALHAAIGHLTGSRDDV